MVANQLLAVHYKPRFLGVPVRANLGISVVEAEVEEEAGMAQK